MRLFAAILLLLSIIDVSAAWTLSSGPYAVTDLGSPVSATTLDNELMMTVGAKVHVILIYDDVVSPYMHTNQLMDCNLTDGTSRLVNGTYGRNNVYGASVYGTNTLFLSSNDPGYLMSYSFSSGAVTNIHQLTQKTAQRQALGQDGNLYIGECCSGGLDEYNITNSTFISIGKMDPAVPDIAYVYVYSMAADTRYVYGGLGESPWYLAIYDTVSSNKTVLFKTDGDKSGSGVERGKTGSLYYHRVTSTNTSLWYSLAGTSPTLLGSAPTNIYQYYEADGVTFQSANFHNNYPTYTINLDSALPNSGLNQATVLWTVSSGPTNTASQSSFDIFPITVNRVYLFNGGLYLSSGDYGPELTCNLSGSSVTLLGYPQYSLYDHTFSGTTVYPVGYPDTALSYNSLLSWTLTASTIDPSTTNPKVLPPHYGKYYYYSTLGSDGMLYLGSTHERDSTGGDLVWYNPSNNSYGNDRTDFVNDEVADLKPIKGATKLLYSSSTTNGTLFTFDVASKSVTAVQVPIAGTSPGKVVETPNGKVFGATGSMLYLWDADSGTMINTASAGGTVFGTARAADRRMVLGPDGYVWLFIGTSLYRVNSTNLTKQFIVTTASTQSPVFNGGDLYLYGTTHIYKIVNLLTYSPDPPTYYISTTGNDAASGLSTNAPWAHHPYMRSFTGSYTHAAGDRFIFRGGDTWGTTNFQMRVVTAQNYFGADSNWFTGSSWSRPVFDFQSTVVSNAAGLQGFQRSAGIYLDGYDTSIPIWGNVFENLDIKNHRTPAGAAAQKACTIMLRGWCYDNQFTNLLVHDWSIASPVGSGDDDGSAGAIQGVFDPLVNASGNTVAFCDINQSGLTQRSGIAIHSGGFLVYSNHVHHYMTAILGSGRFLSNRIDHGENASDPLAHENTIYNQSISTIAYNLITNNFAQGIYESPGLAYPASGPLADPVTGTAISLNHDNVIFLTGFGRPIDIDLEGHSERVGLRSWNNTVNGGSGAAIGLILRAGMHLNYLDLRNNHAMNTAGSGVITFTQSFVSNTVVNLNNITQSTSTAAGQGYTEGNYYAPTNALGATFHAGIDLSAYPFMSVDYLGVLRGTNYDAGAYQFVAGPTPPPTNGVPVVLRVKNLKVGTMRTK